MKKFLILVILSGMLINLFAFEPKVVNVQGKNIKKMNMTKNVSIPIQVSISNIKIGSSEDGKWYYSFYLHNESKNVTIRKDQLDVRVYGSNTLGQITSGIARDIYPQKRILVKNYFKFYHDAKTLTVAVYIKESKDKALAQKDLNLTGAQFKKFVTFENIRLINDSSSHRGNKVAYCIRNRTPYNFSVELISTVTMSIDILGTNRATLLLKKQNRHCGILPLGADVHVLNTVRVNALDINGNTPYTESNKIHPRILRSFEFKSLDKPLEIIQY